MAKLLFTTSSFDLNNFVARSMVEKAGFELVSNPKGRRLTEKEVSELLDDQVIGMVAGTEPLTQKVICKAKSLKIIVRCGVGMDNVDLQEAARLSIRVYNTPDAPTMAVAELTLAHILSLSRRIVEVDRLLHGGQWRPMMGRLISTQTIGIIGFGRIGQAVAQLLKLMGARIIVYDKNPTSSLDIFEYVTWNELLKKSDIITLHLPYDLTTRHIIDEQSFQLMKPSALLINMARGGLIDEQALYVALKEQRIAGAALDCFEMEPYNGCLLECNNIQMSAHMGSYAEETRAKMEAEACVSLVNGLQALGLINI